MACEPENERPSARGSFFCGALRRVTSTNIWCLSAFLMMGCSKPGPSPPPAQAESPKTSTESPRGPQTPTSHRRVIPNLFEASGLIQVKITDQLIGDLPLRFSRSDLKEKTLELGTGLNGDSSAAFVDQHFRANYLKEPVRIVDLLWEDIELAPGAHWLTVVANDDGEVMRIQSRVFFVEVEPHEVPSPPGCVLSTEKQTLNGPKAAQSIRVMALPLVKGIDRLVYEAKGEGLRSVGEIPVGRDVLLRDPPNGDIQLSVRCFSGGKELGSDSNTVTVNGDAPDPEEPGD